MTRSLPTISMVSSTWPVADDVHVFDGLGQFAVLDEVTLPHVEGEVACADLHLPVAEGFAQMPFLTELMISSGVWLPASICARMRGKTGDGTIRGGPILGFHAVMTAEMRSCK